MTRYRVAVSSTQILKDRNKQTETTPTSCIPIVHQKQTLLDHQSLEMSSSILISPYNINYNWQSKMQYHQYYGVPPSMMKKLQDSCTRNGVNPLPALLTRGTDTNKKKYFE